MRAYQTFKDVVKMADTEAHNPDVYKEVQFCVCVCVCACVHVTTFYDLLIYCTYLVFVIIVCINALYKVYTKAIGFSHFELILTGKQRIRVKVVFIMGVYKQWTGLLEWWNG